MVSISSLTRIFSFAIIRENIEHRPVRFRKGEKTVQIAVCDDEKACHETIVKLIGQYQQANPDRSLVLSSFYSGKELLNHVDEYGGFDLYILDCIMT